MREMRGAKPACWKFPIYRRNSRAAASLLAEMANVSWWRRLAVLVAGRLNVCRRKSRHALVGILAARRDNVGQPSRVVLLLDGAA